MTTVLLVDNHHGRQQSLGRFVQVRPSVGLLTSTARTFIQDGVTTEYATQVLGTTLDNGRLYAHLLAKSSRVIYQPTTKTYQDDFNKAWNIDNVNNINNNIQQFVKNTDDFITPSKADTFLVFPTTKPSPYRYVEKQSQENESTPAKEDELLNSAQSSNARVPYEEPPANERFSFSTSQSSSNSNNVKVFKVNPVARNINLQNVIQIKAQSFENDIASHGNDIPKYDQLQPSKVQPKINLPTFTVRNDFSPSGYSFLGDFPDFDPTERSKPTTPHERKGKLLFRGGIAIKPDMKDLQTVTYHGFADFTTTVGDTVIIFSPHSATSKLNLGGGHVTSIPGAATIVPTAVFPNIGSTVKTFLSQEPGMQTETVRGHKLNMHSSLPTMVIDSANRKAKNQNIKEEKEDEEAKSSVLAREQDTHKYDTSFVEPPETVTEKTEDLAPVFTLKPKSESPALTTFFSPEVIQPSETSIPVMLSTPSDEQVKKIFALLAAKAQGNKQATEPLPASTLISENSQSVVLLNTESETKVSGGATTIFFEDDAFFPTDTFGNFGNTLITQSTTNSPPTEENTENLITSPFETTEKLTTTEREQTTLNEITTTSEEVTEPFDQTTPQINNEINKAEQEENNVESSCTGDIIVPTTVYKTLTYLTTFFIPLETTSTTSIKSNIVVSSEIGLQKQPCSLENISPSNTISPITTNPSLVSEPTTPKNKESTTQKETTTKQETTTFKQEPTTLKQEPTTLELTTFKQEETTINQEQTTLKEEQTTQLDTTTENFTTFEATENTTPLEYIPSEITTERRHVTESESEPIESTTDSGEEVEVVYKTLYTTYTYLTTFFQESTSSISSRKVVETNIITSTLEPGSEVTDPAVAGLLDQDEINESELKSKPATFDDLADIQPTKVAELPSESDVNNIKDSTPALDDKLLQTSNAIKTYYTTYTYFTTIFVDGETEISSRTEVYTNYVTPSAIQPTEANQILNTELLEDVVIQGRFGSNQVEAPVVEVDDVNRQVQMSLKVTPSNIYNSTISRQKTKLPEDSDDGDIDNDIIATTKSNLEPSYSTLLRSKSTDNQPTQSLDGFLDLTNNEYEIMVSNVRSSTSVGERRIIDNADKRNALDDQIVAESNNDSEIIPSPTLLLQTSYTTFTYFTTMYHGTTSSNVVSRLETITNVVTETLTPSQTINPVEATLPITYFTTFTYWTTLYKDGSTTVTSREETVSNIVTPTVPNYDNIPTVSITPTETAEIAPSSTSSDDLTTFYTTYTYFTTSYVGDSTVLNSRLETVTNVLNNTSTSEIAATSTQNIIPDDKTTTQTPDLYPTGLLSTEISSVVDGATTTLYSTDVYGTYIDGLYAKVLESTTKILTETIAPSTVSSTLQPTGVVSLNEGKIVDAEGVSTLFYTTQAIGTYIDNLYAQVITSTSSLTVNEERKAALPTTLDPVALAHRTGLVRLIEGSIVQNKTTTVYQSKVLGTVIDGRYAQIIESTSSFIVEKTTAPSLAPTATLASGIVATASPISPSPVVIEGSLNEDSTRADDENSTDEEDDEDDEEIGPNGRVKSRLTFQSKKRTFTPVIRPFVSRNRPTFAPKRKGSGLSSAATITRSDLTPTITATPAIKSESTKGRFGGNRRQSTSISVSATPSGSRRFGSRPRATTSSSLSGSSFRGRSSSRIQPTASGFGSRRGNFRTSSGSPRASSNLFASSSRFRGIRPTLSSSLNRSPNSVTPQPSDNDEGNDLTTQVTDSPTDVTDNESDTTLPLSTTESTLRRSQNPLLRFRRPPLPRQNVAPTTPKTATTPKRNGNLRSKTTTTTPKPKSRRTSQVAALQNRPRAGNGLFPRRDLFKPRVAPTEEPKDDEQDEDIVTGDDLDEEEEEDTEFDGSSTNSRTETAPVIQSRKGRAYTPVQVKPFTSFRRRTKRQISNYSRFRRPTSKTTTTTTEEPTTEAPRTRSSKQTRFRPRSGYSTTQSTTNAPRRLSPTRPSIQGRSQFTLREKDTTTSRSSFKRPTSQSSRRITSKTTQSRPKAPRLRTTTAQTEQPNYSRTTSSRSRGTTRGTTRGRTRQRNGDQLDNYVVPAFDGTITVTHQIPTEVTIPVVNGKITEYKNIVTAKLSTEILGPKQYSTKYNEIGKEVTFLLAESTGINGNGATEITQFILNETPTTSVIFTPTYIRGRKTSFSHVIPSTAYGVDQVVQTIQPQLAAQAPLANILLSQLLLGNFAGIPQQNPLLALQNQNVPNPTPTTEYKTRTTTYVTTVTDETSTVIPLTFRGKEILTTIIDSNINVITATEFLTDTIIVTPTAAIPNNNQLNSLLLPLLLQQQQAGQQPGSPLTSLQPLQQFGLSPDLANVQALLKESAENDVQNKEDEINEQLLALEGATPAPRKKSSRKKSRIQKPVEIAPPPKETSVITLFVSGKRPGEFSTVLSTITLGEENRRRRDVGYVEVKPSQAIYEIISTEVLDKFIMPATTDITLESSDPSFETESLESILGYISKYIESDPLDKDTKYVRSEATINAGQESELSGNFLL